MLVTRAGKTKLVRRLLRNAKPSIAKLEQPEPHEKSTNVIWLSSNDDSPIVVNLLLLLKFAPLILLYLNDHLPTVVSCGRLLRSMAEVNAEYETLFSKAYSDIVLSILQPANFTKVAFEALNALTPIVVKATRPDKSILVIFPLLLL